MKHPDNSGNFQKLKLKYNFFNFLFSFWGCGYKDTQQIERDIPLKKFWETLALFSLPEFPEKERVLPKLCWSCNVTEWVNIV